MKKIVILTNAPDKKALLISWLEILFPECEIEIRTSQDEKVDNPPSMTEDQAYPATTP